MRTILAMLVLGCGLAALLVLVKAWRLRTGIYGYDVRGDQRYDFPPSRTTRVVGRLVGGVLDLPPPQQPSDVVLLEVRIRSTPLGRWFEPCLEIRTARGSWRQPFERGCAGLRFVDLSHAAQQGEAAVQLTGRCLEIRDQSVVLHYLHHDIDFDRQKILVLASHPDDAEIAAFGVYADRDAYVVTLTAGEDGELGPFKRFSGQSAYREKGRNRAWNSLTVPMLGGLSIKRTANLGYFDGTLTAMKTSPGVAVRSVHADADSLGAFGGAEDESLIGPRHDRRATWTNLVADLEHVLERLQPDLIVAPYPRLEAHPDHKMSTVALVEALKNLNWRRGSLLLYANHLSTSDRYPFGDAGDLVSLPSGIDGIFFDGIVSHPLDGEMQHRKHMALDAMVDLRPDIEIGSLRSVAKSFQRVLRTTLTDGHASYFRQAVRANELFFEVRVSSLYEPGVTEKILG